MATTEVIQEKGVDGPERNDQIQPADHQGESAVLQSHMNDEQQDENAPPDGGLQAWLQVLSAFVIMVDTYGLLNSFGMFQTYYETDLLSDRSSSDISWIGSIQGALLLLLGVVSGPLFDRGHFRKLIATGLFLVVFGMFMTSLCETFWQVVLAQGVCVGIGSGLMFLPSAAVLSQYFRKRRAIALGLQSSGSPIAGIVFPIIFGRLRPLIGFGWATRVIAFILLGISVVPLLFMRSRVRPAKAAAPTTPAADTPAANTAKKSAATDISETFRDMSWLMLALGGFFGFMGLYVPYFYIELYAIRYGIVPTWFSSYLVTLLNTGSVFGRIVPNFFADYLGSYNMLCATTLGGAVLGFGWLGIHNFPAAIVFCLLFGFFNGGMTSLPPSAIAAVTPDLSKLGTRMGMSFVFYGIATLVGTPIAGAILGDGEADIRWDGLALWTGVTMVLGGALFTTGQVLNQWKLKKKERAAVGGWGSTTE